MIKFYDLGLLETAAETSDADIRCQKLFEEMIGFGAVPHKLVALLSTMRSMTFTDQDFIDRFVQLRNIFPSKEEESCEN